MFDNRLSFSNGAILIVYFIFLGLLILAIFFGRFWLWFSGRKKITTLNGQEIWTKMNLTVTVKTLVISPHHHYWTSWLGFKEKSHRLSMNLKTFNDNNLQQLSYAFSIISSSENSYSQNRFYRYQYWGLTILLGLIFCNTLTILLLLFLAPQTDTLNGGKIILGVQIALQALAIFGWLMIVVLILWWASLNQNRNSEILFLANKHLSKSEYQVLKKYLKIQSVFPFSVHY